MKFLDKTGLTYLWGKIKGAFVPVTRKINDKPLSTDVTLAASDIDALPLSGGVLTGPVAAQSNMYVYNSALPTVLLDETANASTHGALLRFRHSDRLFYIEVRPKDASSGESYRLPTPTNTSGAYDILTTKTLNGVTGRTCRVGQSGGTTTKPWYKVATCAMSGNTDSIITFLVENTYGSHIYGILRIHVRSNSGVVDSTVSDMVWLSKTEFDDNDFVLVCPTSTNPTVELWTKVAEGYQFRRFTVLAEGDRTTAKSMWTLLTASSAGQSDSITTSGTQIKPKTSEFYLQLTGGTLTDAITFATAAGDYSELIQFARTTGSTELAICKNDGGTTSRAFVFRQYRPSGTYRENYHLPGTTDNLTASTNYNILTTKPAESIYTRLCPNVDLTTNPSAQVNNDVIRFYDKNSKGFGYISGTQYTDGQTNVVVSAYRTVGGTTVYNGLTLGVTPEKERIVSFTDVNVWRSALLMLYKAGDTYSESASVLNGIIRSGGKLIALRVTLPKSLQNISNISVTALKGWIASSSGIIDSSGDGTNWITKSGVTVRASKKDNYTLLIVLETETVLSNAVVGICGALISFTLSFS